MGKGFLQQKNFAVHTLVEGGGEVNFGAYVSFFRSDTSVPLRDFTSAGF